ncbi:hypothetical protein EYV94_28090 [Puteibacter caeruleilacunae]|nr:hypothetical protein EYV94_28090 [Puteibacter caeruleilacunae]
MKKYTAFMLVLICVSCINTLRGHRGVSDTVKESKNRNVFVRELQAKSNLFQINDTLKINIKSAWIEKRWAYGDKNSETIPLDEYQLIINTDESSICYFPKFWQIGKSFKESFRRSGKESMMIDISSLPNGGKLEWNVTSGNRRYDGSRIIGKFELILSPL